MCNIINKFFDIYRTITLRSFTRIPRGYTFQNNCVLQSHHHKTNVYQQHLSIRVRVNNLTLCYSQVINVVLHQAYNTAARNDLLVAL